MLYRKFTLVLGWCCCSDDYDSAMNNVRFWAEFDLNTIDLRYRPWDPLEMMKWFYLMWFFATREMKPSMYQLDLKMSRRINLLFPYISIAEYSFSHLFEFKIGSFRFWVYYWVAFLFLLELFLIANVKANATIEKDFSFVFDDSDVVSYNIIQMFFLGGRAQFVVNKVKKYDKLKINKGAKCVTAIYWMLWRCEILIKFTIKF